MDDAKILAESRARVGAAGLGARDIAFLDKLGWREGATLKIESDAQAADYKRLEEGLNKAVAHLTFAERADSPEGKLAAALGAHLANWRDKDEDE